MTEALKPGSRAKRPRCGIVRARFILGLTTRLGLWLGLVAANTATYAQKLDVAYRTTILSIQQHIQNNDLEGAQTLLEAAFKQYPADGGLENLAGVIEIQQGHVEPAEKDFTTAIKDSPRLASAYLNLARVYMESGRELSEIEREKVMRLYARVEMLDPSNREAISQEATLLLWSRKYQASLNKLDNLSKWDRAGAQSQASPRVQAIICADQAGLGHKVETGHAAAAMAGSPDLKEQDVFLTLPQLRAAHRADLIDSLLTAAGARQNLSPGGLRMLGLAEEAEGKRDQAHATIERVFTMDNSNADALVDLARIAVAEKDDHGALQYLAHARDLRPSDPGVVYEFGLVCMRLKLLGEAMKAMGTAVKLAPENPEYNFGMGTVMALAEDPSQALPYLEKFHQLRPADVAGILELGAAYYHANAYEKATPLLGKAAEYPGTAASAHYYLGGLLRRREQYADAVRELQASIALRPEQPDTYAELGQVYVQMQKYPEAERELDHAIALDGQCYAANFALLKLYARIDDPRRQEQAKRFETIRDSNAAQYSEAMRVIEARPEIDEAKGSPKD